MAIIIGVVLAIAISSSSARIQTINGDLNEDCNDDPNWIDNKYGDGSSKCTDMTSNYCENYGEYSTEAQKNCPVACGMCSGTSSSATIAATTTPPGRIVALTTSAGVKKTENRFCWTYEAYGSYYNLNAAISACKADENCGYIYDVDCDNNGSFQLCKLNAETQKSGQGSCIYKISKQKALSKQGAEKACNEFGNGWSVNVVRDGSVVCTLNSLNWGKNCNKCDTWRLVVWKDGAHERKPGYGGYNGIQISTKAGRYYGGHDPCEIGDNLPVCGEWSTHPDVGSGYENPEVSSGLKELSTQLLTSTRAPTLQTTENIQSTQGNTPGHQSSHCRDQKIWCNLADCSLANVKRNCQKTCNLC